MDITDLGNREFTMIHEENSSVDSPSLKHPLKGARHQTPKADAMTGKPETNLLDTDTTPRVRSAGKTTVQRPSNLRSTEKGKIQVIQLLKGDLKIP